MSRGWQRRVLSVLAAWLLASGSMPPAVAGPSASCACDCPEFFSSKREACRSQCANYGPLSTSCVIQRERSRGRSDADIETAIKDCSTDCAVLRSETRPLCLDAVYPLVIACKASGPQGATARRVDCYLDYLVRELEEPMKSQFRQQNADQLAAMDQQGRDLFVGNMLDALSGEGYRCPR
ncbi:MAG: hypothetical protein C0434_06010 [Xanthomonadaceae bacterium]|nr:hypothetical protein [Xanthomonadaceae bacterium]